MTDKERVWYEIGFGRGMTVGIAIFVAVEMVFAFMVHGVLK